MPAYEYRCDSCEVEFEELLTQTDDVRAYASAHPCPGCGSMAPRILSAANFAFKAPARASAGSGVHGQSGVHDLDYPSVDKAVGRSSAKRWDAFNAKKAERDRVRRESGTNSISTIGGKPVPIDPTVAKVREGAISTFNAVKKASGKP